MENRQRKEEQVSHSRRTKQADKRREEKKDRREEIRGKSEEIRREEAQIQGRKDETHQATETVEVLKEKCETKR
jgi:hypothetical protein